MWSLLNLKFVIQVIQFVHESLDYFPHICNFLKKKKLVSPISVSDNQILSDLFLNWANIIWEKTKIVITSIN